ncbi:DUF3293 domain-containing protein, partial [Ferrimicrobium acidiphilum]|uniref:DUF3293 domain-containing protein n=1 Tax=Ferrimicrobium acidiphilum TaxID=121039 RepID=UPI0023F40800
LLLFHETRGNPRFSGSLPDLPELPGSPLRNVEDWHPRRHSIYGCHRGYGTTGRASVHNIKRVGARSILFGMPGINGCLSPIFVSIPNFGLVRAAGVNRGMGRANIGEKESIAARGNIGMKETESVSITEISAIAPELLAIYRASEYRVEDADPPFVMYVDQPCLDLVLFMKRHGAQRALFISAWNPASLPRSEAENQAAQEDLEVNLKTWGYRVFHGIGEDPMGGGAPVSRAAVRLACVKHAASVQSEPGSNSSVHILFLTQKT